MPKRRQACLNTGNALNTHQTTYNIKAAGCNNTYGATDCFKHAAVTPTATSDNNVVTVTVAPMPNIGTSALHATLTPYAPSTRPVGLNAHFVTA